MNDKTFLRQHLVSSHDLSEYQNEVNRLAQAKWRVIPESIRVDTKDSRGYSNWNGAYGSVFETYICVMEQTVEAKAEENMTPKLTDPEK